MAIPKSRPMRFTARGLCDAFDSTDAFPGACTALTNLVFDQSNPEYVLPRPGVVTAALLAALGYSNAGFISIQLAIGSRIYGMVSTSLNPGRDRPFCYDSAGNVLLLLGGVTNANCPLSAGTVGDWTPPTAATIGNFLVFTHPGFDGSTHFVGFLDLNLLTWTASNLAGAPLSAGIPVAVANFNNRAYYAFGTPCNKLAYSDVLTPAVRTNASQQLVIGDTTPINALAGLPLQTTSSGVLQALLIFKATQVWQVTGDTVTGDLAENFLSLSVGTTMPRSIAQSPQGTYFGGSGGPYVVDPIGTVRQLTHMANSPNPDINVPFQSAVTPTRWAGAYCAGIYRVCGPTSLLGQLTTNDYWFDERRRRWSGPHTFAYDCASVQNGNFVLSSALFPGRLILSPPLPNAIGLGYTDILTPYACTLQSATFPKTGEMLQKQVAESQIELGDAATYQISALDETGAVMNSVSITTAGSNPPTWGGGGTWGGGLKWTANSSGPAKTYSVPWTAPLVFEKMALKVTATAGAKVQLGSFEARYQETGYMTLRQGV